MFAKRGTLFACDEFRSCAGFNTHDVYLYEPSNNNNNNNLFRKNKIVYINIIEIIVNTNSYFLLFPTDTNVVCGGCTCWLLILYKFELIPHY